MQGFSPKLPLIYDHTDDGLYALNKTLLDTIRQNLKMLLLTSPGERIMDSNFGVGIRKFLFEQDTFSVREELQNKIATQVALYLNFIVIEEIDISPPNSNDENVMFIKIRYKVPSINTNDELNITL
jgi:phage baseplate assembly protein W